MPYRRKYNGRSTRRRTNINRSVSRAVTAHQETKNVRLSAQFLTLPTSGLNIELNALSTGPDNGERIGNRVRNVRLTSQLVSVGCGPVRLVIYCPKNPLTSLQSTQRFAAIDPSDFWVLHDKVYGNGGKTQSNDMITINLNKKLNFHTQWGNSSSNGFSKNPLKAFITTDVQSGGQGTLEGYFQTFYKDG